MKGDSLLFSEKEAQGIFVSIIVG